MFKNMLEDLNVSVRILEISESVQGCIGCGRCWKKRRCVNDDEVNMAADLMNEADALVLISGVSYGQPPKTLTDFMDRLTHCISDVLSDRIAAFISIGKKHSCLQAAKQVEEYFDYAGMIQPGSKTHHSLCGSDAENEDVLNSLARRLVWLMECIQYAEENGIEKAEGTYHRELDYVR